MSGVYGGLNSDHQAVYPSAYHQCVSEGPMSVDVGLYRGGECTSMQSLLIGLCLFRYRWPIR